MLASLARNRSYRWNMICGGNSQSSTDASLQLLLLLLRYSVKRRRCSSYVSFKVLSPPSADNSLSCVSSTSHLKMSSGSRYIRHYTRSRSTSLTCFSKFSAEYTHTHSNIGATTTGTDVLVPQLLGRSFQKARNFTASSHQNAGFSI